MLDDDEGMCREVLTPFRTTFKMFLHRPIFEHAHIESVVGDGERGQEVRTQGS